MGEEPSAARPPTVEQMHEARIAARIAKERAEREADARTYLEIVNEIESPSSWQAQRLVVVLANAIGVYSGDPLTSIVEEIKQRCETLVHTARGGYSGSGDAHGVLEALERELDMLHWRANVARELLRRLGSLDEHCKAVLR